MNRIASAISAAALVAASTATALAIILWPAPAAAQAAVPIDRKTAAEVLANLDAALRSYVFPDKAKAIQAKLKARREDYLKIAGRDAFAAAVTEDMRAAGQDLHLYLRPDDMALAAQAASRAAPSEAEGRALYEAQGFGFTDARRLPGNIGYLNLRNFGDETAWPVIDAAMTLLQHTDALIIDLRENTGGSVAHARLLGHLSAKPIPMETIYWRRPDGGFDTMRTEASVAAGGPLYPDRPVFVLISQRTFSAAEAFAYSIKVAGRATLVGEKTRGGGNPSNRSIFPGAGLRAGIPNGRVEHSVTGGTWEQSGIAPDVATSKETALVEAYGRALKAAKPAFLFDTVEAQRAQALADPAKAVAGL